MQVTPGGPAEDLLQVAHVSVRQRTHVLDPPPGQDLLSPRAHAPQGPDRQQVEEVLRGAGRHKKQPIGLGVGRGELGDELGGGDAHRGRNAHTTTDLGTDPPADGHWRAHAAPGPGNVQEGLVDAHLLQNRGDLRQDGHDLRGDLGVEAVAHGQDHGLGAASGGLGHGHRRGDAEGAGLIGGR